ncbi:MAG: spore germination protein [Clostridiales bacterium]|nr:spore germination protein [Clostridiales bacterium]
MNSNNAGDVFDRSHTIFSENHKISPRQIRRAMTLELFGVGSLLLPTYLAGESGILGVFALMVGAAGAWALVCVWDRLSKHCDFEGSDLVAGRGNAQVIMRRILLILAGIGLLETAAFVLYLLTALIREQLLTGRYEAAVLITLAAAGVFGLWKGLESRIRIYEVLFWLLLVPLFIILIIACASVRPMYWTMTSFTMPGFWKSCLICFLFFSISSLILFFKPHCNPPEKAAKSVRRSILLALILILAVYLILIGIFQDALLSQLTFPVILLMAVVKIPGQFFERQDAFMTGIWFFCLFALFHSLLYYGRELLCNAFSRRCADVRSRGAVTDHRGTGRETADAGPASAGRETPGAEQASAGRETPGAEQASAGRKQQILSVVCGGAVFSAALFLLRREEAAGWYMNMLLCLTAPVLLILPFIYFYISRTRQS